MKDTETAQHINHQLENEIAAMDVPELDVIIAHATELREQKHAERIAKLQREAQALGATIKLNGTKGTRRGRPRKQHDPQH